LQHCRDAQAGRERLEAVAEGVAQRSSQVGTEGTIHSGLHHVDAPDQQGDRSGEIDQRQGGVHANPSNGSTCLAAW
jgi:hypothetical protein